MHYTDVITLAKKHVNNGAVMRTSAQLCLDDAIRCIDKGMLDSAKMWAIKSLGYSVGIFHPDYQAAIDNKFELFESIARQHFNIESLKRCNIDSKDFHSVAVWNIEAALAEAYQAGVDSKKVKL